ncbi:MAG: putative lipopolysaccharide heptosyltransferase III [Burkholderiales bacterium]
MVEDAVPLEAVRRALVVKLRHQGDVLLASPVFSVLKRSAPHAEVDALVYADTAPMLTGHPAISEVFCIDRGWKTLGPLARAGAEWKLLSALRARRYDLLVQLTEHWRGAWLARALGARWAVAPRVAGRGRFWKKSFTHLVSKPLASARHVVEGNLDALRRIGIYPGVEERGLTLVAGPAAEERIARLLVERGLAGQSFVQVHPCSRWRFKCWPADKMAALIDRLHSEGHRVVLTAAPDKAEAQMIDDILARVAQPVAANLAGQLSLKELAALTARARLFIGVDSAPMHVAAAVRTPAVAIFGPSGADLWGPWGVPRSGRHRVVAKDEYTCRPCGLDGCGGGKVSDCLVTLEVARVWAAASELLETR